MLITNVTDVEQPIDAVPSVDTLEELADPLHKLYELALTGDIELAAETYYRAGQYVATVTELYTDGKLSLAEKAFAEQCYAALCRRLHRALTAAQRSHRQVYDELHDKLADKYFCNFSVFSRCRTPGALASCCPPCLCTGWTSSRCAAPCCKT